MVVGLAAIQAQRERKLAHAFRVGTMFSFEHIQRDV